MFAPLLVSLLLAAPGDLPAVGTALVYEGRMAGVKEDGDPQIKEFELQLVLAEASADETTWLWTLSETGRGGFTWTDRFGRWTTRGDRRDESVGPALLYRRADGDGVVPLVPPLFPTAEALAAGDEWSEGRLDYRVLGAAKREGRDCWELQVRSPVGHKRTLYREQSSAVVAMVRETVFLGQGVQHELNFRLTKQAELKPDALAQAIAAADRWSEVKTEMQRAPRAKLRELSDEQLAVVKANIDELVKTSAGTLLETIAVAAQKDLQNQRGRSAAVAATREQALTKGVALEQLFDLTSKPLNKDDFAGKVVVLHFWTYRDSPLEEPYGQVGYLDFLHRKRSDAGVTVIGVHVDEKLADEETRRGSIAAAKRLKNFMNLHYTVAFDGGAVLKALGDPRVGGGSLPLYVVLDKTGKVAEYRAGFYEVKPDKGLVELDAVIDRLLGEKP